MSYRGFLNLNYDTIVASLVTTAPDKWISLDVTWSRRFLDEAEILLKPNTFAAIKEKVRLFYFAKYG